MFDGILAHKVCCTFVANGLSMCGFAHCSSNDGCYGFQVRNRTQEEVAKGVSAADADLIEQQYFAGKPANGDASRISKALLDLPGAKKGKQALIALLLKVQGLHLQGR